MPARVDGESSRGRAERQAHGSLPLALQGFSSQFTSSYGQLNAFIVMSILPVLVVYLMFQRFFTQGALAGAVKG